jgi:tetratricopeptide (TPR) repeat protein
MFAYMKLERGRYDSARRWAEALLALEPDDLTGHFLAGDVEAWDGRWEASREIYQRLYDVAPDVRLAGVWWSARLGLGYALHELGRTEEAEPLLERALANARARIDRGEEYPMSFVEISMVQAIRGERQAALEWLERAYEAGWRYGFLATLPHFVLLRDDPDFQRITARIDEDIAAMRASRAGP